LRESANVSKKLWPNVIKDLPRAGSGGRCLVFEGVTPMGKPRMTKSDKWKKRAVVQRYWQFKAELVEQGKRQSFLTIPRSGYWMIFFLPMPQSWPESKKSKLDLTPHLQQKPDKDNLEKAVLDAFGEDHQIWDGRVSKFWAREGRIEILF
jgi:Holliday junction resolvase RusA-like endonuclease